jgi:hypothetical protein
MEDDLNILLNGRQPQKLKTVLKTVTSHNLTNTTTKKILARLKQQKSIGCDIIVN